MTKLIKLAESITQELSDLVISVRIDFNEITVESNKAQIKQLLQSLRDRSLFSFEQLIDLCAVDYLKYGESEWETESTTDHGFSRGVEPQWEDGVHLNKPRFAVVYHLLSITHNHRLRVKVFLDASDLIIPSMTDIWSAANWFEREAYDLYGILFENHPDLRRILTDYGFIGYPFRKDFPLSGHVEMRYDALLQQVIYEAVDIDPRTLVPKVIRNDNRTIVPTGAVK